MRPTDSRNGADHAPHPNHPLRSPHTLNTFQSPKSSIVPGQFYVITPGLIYVIIDRHICSPTGELEAFRVSTMNATTFWTRSSERCGSGRRTWDASSKVKCRSQDFFGQSV